MNERARGRVGVVGLGYVGLPLALAMADAGYEVVGVDVDESRIQQLRDGRSYVGDVTHEEVASGIEGGLEPTTEYSALSDVSGVSICVPTPLRKSESPDMSFVLDASERLASVVSAGTTVVLESTVYPGATEEIVGKALRENGWTVGEDVFLAFSPERIDPANEEYGPTEIPKVLGGVTDACGDHAEALYEPVFDEVVRVESVNEAEFVKLLENTFRAVNIGLVNELAQAADRLDIDIWNTVNAAATKPFGFMPFYPGPGLGGHCIPIDPFYLSWKAKEQGIDTRFIQLADQVNRHMPEHVFWRLTDQLNARGVPLREASVLVVGVAYKANVSDTRESPAYDVIGHLQDRNVEVTYHDPHVPSFEIEERLYESHPLTPELLAEQDAVIVLTDHATVDFEMVVEHSPHVFDTRNITGERGVEAENVVRL